MIHLRVAWIVLSVLYQVLYQVSALTRQEELYILKEFNLIRSSAPGLDIKPLKWDEALGKEAKARTCSNGQQFVSYQSPYTATETTSLNFLEDFVQSVGQERLQLVKTYAELKRDDPVGVNVQSNYTQVVWAKSRSIGCATASCKRGIYGIACVLDPVGNVRGQRAFTYGSKGEKLDHKIIIISLLILTFACVTMFIVRSVVPGCRSKSSHSENFAQVKDPITPQHSYKNAARINTPTLKTPTQPKLKKAVLFEFTATAPSRLPYRPQESRSPRVDVVIQR